MAEHNGSGRVKVSTSIRLHCGAFIFSLVLPALLFAFQPRQTISRIENRQLKVFPQWTWRGMVEGRYAPKLAAYLADHFPNRQEMLVWAQAFRTRFGFRLSEGKFIALRQTDEASLDNDSDWADLSDHTTSATPDEAGTETVKRMDYLSAGTRNLVTSSVPLSGGTTSVCAKPSDSTSSFELSLPGASTASTCEPSMTTELSSMLRFQSVSDSRPIARVRQCRVPAMMVDDIRGQLPTGSVKLSRPPTATREDHFEGEGDNISRQDVAAPRATPLLRRKGILIHRGRAMQSFGGSVSRSLRWSHVLNQYRKNLPSGVRVFAMAVPSPAAFYLPQKYRRISLPEKPIIDEIYKALAPGVVGVDVYRHLLAHKREYIYFRTDHHWTVRGAYYAYRAFADAAGIDPLPLSRMQVRTKSRWLGSLYWYTREPTLRASRDTVEYFLPNIEHTARCTSKRRVKRFFPCKLIDPSAWHYGVFLGGDRPLMVVNTNLKGGRRALVVKNSYGNPFATFLPQHFDRVVIIDYRHTRRGVLQLVREYGITDLIFINGMFTINTSFHVNRIKRIMDRPHTK